MSPLPITRSALDRLGERLVANDEISDDDYDLLLRVLTAYQSALGETQDRLIALGYAPTTRVKTTPVLVEKLRREEGMKLKGVQDIAGARIVVDGGRIEQDDVVERIVAAFADESRAPKVKDRRYEPSAGYRAVHVVVTVQHVPVEIQVRTRWQDQWAQIVESLGDKWGRALRYGGDPDRPDTVVLETAVTRRDIWKEVLELSEFIDHSEDFACFHAIIEQLASEESPPTTYSTDSRPSIAAAMERFGITEPLRPVGAESPALAKARVAMSQGDEVTRALLGIFARLADVVQ